MSTDLHGRRIAFLVDNSGVEQIELVTPRTAMEEAGATTQLIAPEAGTVQGFENDVEQADTFQADLAVGSASAADFDALVLPGGTTNADGLRQNSDAVALVKSFVDAGKPVASICHGPWALVEAGVLEGKQLTSYPSLQTDIRNAGGTWMDEPSVVCPANGWTLVTSRNPGDLDDFVAAATAAFAESHD